MRDEMRQFREASEHADFTSGDSETRCTLISPHSPGHDYIFSCPPGKHYLIFDFVTINEVTFLELFIHYAEPDLKYGHYAIIIMVAATIILIYIDGICRP